jgi:sugar lactone lactonase YvrE
MKGKALLAGAALLAACILYLLAWPTGMEPQAWTPPPAPSLAEGVYAYNEKLKSIQKLALDVGVGPEGLAINAVGQIYAGYADGRIVRIAPNGATWTKVGNTHGRPLGITLGPDGGYVIADARKGLLLLGSKVHTLATEAGGVPFGFTDDVDHTRHELYFTDASSKFGYGKHMTDLLEHGGNGRLLEYSLVTKQTRVLMSGLHFANGVAVGPEGNYVLVNETGEYRVLRYWLKGEKAGTHDVFIDNLPGFPDNISYNKKGVFWLAIFAPRDALLDGLLPGSLYLRTVLAKLPGFLQPRPKKHAFVLGLDASGKVVANLQYAGPDAYAPITSAREHGSFLYFGSLTYPALGRLPLNQALPDAPPPPPGWEALPETRAVPGVQTREDQEEQLEEIQRRREGKTEEEEEEEED